MRAVVLSNGGIKATVAINAALLTKQYDKIIALDVRFGGESDQQGFASCDVAKHFLEQGAPIERMIVDVADVFAFGGHGMPSLPASDAVLVTTALAIAGQVKANVIIMGHCRNSTCDVLILDALRHVTMSVTDGSTRLLTPNEYKPYAEVIRTGLVHQAPLQLTRTCKYPGPTECLVCVPCVKRIEAINRIRDERGTPECESLLPSDGEPIDYTKVHGTLA